MKPDGYVVLESRVAASTLESRHHCTSSFLIDSHPGISILI